VPPNTLTWSWHSLGHDGQRIAPSTALHVANASFVTDEDRYLKVPSFDV